MRKLACVLATAGLLTACGGGASGGGGAASAPVAAPSGNEGATAGAPATVTASAGGGGNYTDTTGACSMRTPDGWVAFGNRGRMDPARHEVRATLRAIQGTSAAEAVTLVSGMMSGRVISDTAERTIIQGSLAGTTEFASISKSTPICSALITAPTPADEAGARAIAESVGPH